MTEPKKETIPRTLSTHLIEQAEAVQGLSQTDFLFAVQSSGSQDEEGEDSSREGYTVDDIQGVLENDSTVIPRDKLESDSLSNNGDQSPTYDDAWSVKPSYTQNSQSSSGQLDVALGTVIQPNSSPLVLPELHLDQDQSLHPNVDADSDNSSKPGSPGHVLKIVESWEGNIDEYHLSGRDSKSPVFGSGGKWNHRGQNLQGMNPHPGLVPMDILQTRRIHGDRRHLRLPLSHCLAWLSPVSIHWPET